MFGIIHCGTFLLFSAFALFLVTSISSPVISRISFMDIYGADFKATFGTFGYCIDLKNGRGACTSRMVGYALPDAVAAAFSDGTWNVPALENLSGALILHPIACGIAFIALVVCVCSDRLGYIAASILALIAFIVALVVCIIDFVMFGVMINQVNDHTNLRAKYSNATWLALAGTILLFLSVFFVLFSCCAARRKDRKRDEQARYEAGGYVGNGAHGEIPPAKHHWWEKRKY